MRVVTSAPVEVEVVVATLPELRDVSVEAGIGVVDDVVAPVPLTASEPLTLVEAAVSVAEVAALGVLLASVELWSAGRALLWLDGSGEGELLLLPASGVVEAVAATVALAPVVSGEGDELAVGAGALLLVALGVAALLA